LSIGKTYQDPRHRHIDVMSGREIHQLTDYRGHSFQFYFTHPCWIGDNSAFIFASDRENHRDYFRYDLDSGLVTQLTDSATRPVRGCCLSPVTDRLYFWSGRELCEFDLASLTERTVCVLLDGMSGDRPAATADGKHVCVLLCEESTGSGKTAHYGPPTDGGSRERFERQPLSQVVRIDVASGEIDVLHEDRRYISHVNASPTRPNLLTFCHEGPWELIDQRIWCVNADTKEVWPIRPQEGAYSVVAEHWLADGKRIGFRSHLRSAGDTRFGHIRFDNKEHIEAKLGAYSRHFHTHDGSLVVGDGSPIYALPKMINSCETWPYILLYAWNADGYGTPRIIAEHGSTFNGNPAHCHPRFTPDGKHVLYTSDTSGYANIYMVEVGKLDELPELRI
jgi:oligogalacturonide lyase